MNRKEAYLQALKTLPEDTQEYLEVPIPTMQAGVWPIEDTETAIIMQGILAYNLNVILTVFAGLRPLEILLRIGQFNPSIIGLYLSALEVLNTDELHTMEILAPTDGASLDPGDYTFQARITGGLEDCYLVQVTIVDAAPEPIYSPQTASLGQNAEDESLFETTLTLYVGEAFTVTFQATFEPDYVVEQTVNITVPAA